MTFKLNKYPKKVFEDNAYITNLKVKNKNR